MLLSILLQNGSIALPMAAMTGTATLLPNWRHAWVSDEANGSEQGQALRTVRLQSLNFFYEPGERHGFSLDQVVIGFLDHLGHDQVDVQFIELGELWMGHVAGVNVNRCLSLIRLASSATWRKRSLMEVFEASIRSCSSGNAGSS